MYSAAYFLKLPRNKRDLRTLRAGDPFAFEDVADETMNATGISSPLHLAKFCRRHRPFHRDLYADRSAT